MQSALHVDLLVLCALSIGGVALTAQATDRHDQEKSGGETTVYASGRLAFSFPAANLDEAGRTRFALGNSFFRRNWMQAPSSTAARDGLGPHFIARSCGGCHDQGGRGAPPRTMHGRGREQPMALLLRLSIPGTDEHGGPRPDPVYGDQLTTSAVQGVRREARVRVEYHEHEGRFADTTPYSLREPRYRIVDTGYGPLADNIMVSPRIAQQVIGVGLLEAIAEDDIVAYSAQQAKRTDRIHGVPNRVWDAVAQKMVLGRFGWKANAGSLAHQVAAAFSADMGITSSYFHEERCTAAQIDCLAAPRGNNGTQPEIDDRTLANVIFYQALLAPPARRNVHLPITRRGEALFHRASCAACHRPYWVTAAAVDEQYSSPALAAQLIHPYTDLLLHDMGEALADGRPDFQASTRQWRTPPLWGIGMIREVNGHQYLLHDGRARGVLEAILWHSGEAEYSKRQVLNMSHAQRDALVRFVESL
jgi:CxxC motif-containing protein (DUF1111 family)